MKAVEFKIKSESLLCSFKVLNPRPYKRLRLRFLACVAFALTASAAFDLAFPPPAAASAAAAPAVSAAPLLTALAPPLAVSGLCLRSN